MKVTTDFEKTKKSLEDEKRKLETEIKLLNEDKNSILIKMNKITKNLVTLEIENETFLNKNRINEEIIQDLKKKGENLFEKMTILQTESETIKNSSDEKLVRIKQQLRETEEEMMALKKRRNSLLVNDLKEEKEIPNLEKLRIIADSKLSLSINNKKTNSGNHQKSNLSTFGLKNKKNKNDVKRENYDTNNLQSSDKNISKFSLQKKMSKHNLSRKNLRLENVSSSKHILNNNINNDPKNEWFYNFICSLDQKLQNIKHNLDANK